MPIPSGVFVLAGDILCTCIIQNAPFSVPTYGGITIQQRRCILRKIVIVAIAVNRLIDGFGDLAAVLIDIRPLAVQFYRGQQLVIKTACLFVNRIVQQFSVLVCKYIAAVGCFVIAITVAFIRPYTAPAGEILQTLPLSPS